MNILAPAVLCFGLSYALYSTVEIWPIAVYTMQSKSIPPHIATDVDQLQKGVRQKAISGQQAESIFRQKHGIPSQSVRNVMGIGRN